MATCMICGKGPHHGTTLFRQNPKGEAGIWACMAHSQQAAAPEVNKLVAVIERDAMDKPTNEREQAAMRRGQAAELERLRTPAGAVVSAYRIGDGIGAIKVERVQQIDGPDLWAVRRHGDVLGRAGEWEWEPMPSSRDDEFLARCRFDTHTAAIAALYAAISPAPATVSGSQP